MPRADVDMILRSRGASLNAISRELRSMDNRKVKELFRRSLEGAARPYPDRVRAKVMAIPVKPGGRATGLRERIAGCVSLSSGTDAKSGWVSVWVDVRKMLPGYLTLPLYMEGARVGRRGDIRWRHPVFGRSDDPWEQQDPHPYFDEPTRGLGQAAGRALKAALEDITRQING